MQEWNLVFDNNRELILTCRDAEITRNGLGEITNIHWNGIIDNIPIKADLNDCKLIYYKNLPKEDEGDTNNANPAD